MTGTRRAKFGDFVIRAHRMRIHAPSLNPSRAGTLYRRMRVFSDDRDALCCARLIPDPLPRRLRLSSVTGPNIASVGHRPNPHLQAPHGHTGAENPSP